MKKGSITLNPQRMNLVSHGHGESKLDEEESSLFLPKKHTKNP